MNPNDVYSGWYLLSNIQSRFIFQKPNIKNVQIVIEANSYDDAKQTLIDALKNSVSIASQ